MASYTIDGALIHIETDRLKATVRTEGYTSGVMAGSLLDKKTGARDLGFGLSIVDFLLEPADPDQPVPEGQYHYGDLVHGNIPKRYVEGPQICTQARKLEYDVLEGDGFIAVRQWFRWHEGYAPYKRGSRWEQLLVFRDGARYFLSSDRVTTVNASPALFLRIDMPGHLKHDKGDNFEQIYLSYHGLVPASAFLESFPPDAHFLYRRGRDMQPQRFIRAYQVKQEGEPGPWLAGMTLEPSDTYEAWCHQRGYVCLIQEIGGRPTKPRDTFGAAYAIGWFDDLEDMHAAYDRHKGTSGWELAGPPERPTAVRGRTQRDLSPVPDRTHQ
jgi:hypothetical protein